MGHTTTQVRERERERGVYHQALSSVFLKFAELAGSTDVSKRQTCPFRHGVDEHMAYILGRQLLKLPSAGRCQAFYKTYIYT